MLHRYFFQEYLMGIIGKALSLFAVQVGIVMSTWSGVTLAQVGPQPGVIGPDSYTTLAVLVGGITAASVGTASVITFMFKNKNRLERNDRVTRTMVRHIKDLYRAADKPTPEDMEDI